jgi:nitrite reductase (NO-forming)
VRAKAPTYTVFNGRYNGMVETPVAAKPGERVRHFVMNVGPSNTSGFHVVGTIFDRVWIDGNPDTQFRGMQTVLLGSASGAIVEFVIPEAGNYVMVDHHFARIAGRDRDHRCRRVRGGPGAPQHSGDGEPHRRQRGPGQPRVRVEVPGMPLDCRRRQARPRSP